MPDEILVATLIVVGLAGAGWFARDVRRQRLITRAQDHNVRAFLSRGPLCRCDACQAWRRIWGQG